MEESEKEEETITSERPPKPRVPTPRECAGDPLWNEAYRREAEKFKEMSVMKPLSMGKDGRFLRPHNALIQRLIAVREWKWKKDPHTGIPRWLECIRLVLDGSTDSRQERFYAGTPDRMYFLLMMSAGATRGEIMEMGDMERAYLQSTSSDRNIVVQPKGESS